jgi:hypothetical protein
MSGPPTSWKAIGPRLPGSDIREHALERDEAGAGSHERNERACRNAMVRNLVRPFSVITGSSRPRMEIRPASLRAQSETWTPAIHCSAWITVCRAACRFDVRTGQGKKPASLGRYKAAIAKLHLLLDLPGPTKPNAAPRAGSTSRAACRLRRRPAGLA